MLADCIMLEAIGLAEFHQSGCPLLLRKQLQTHIFCLALYSLPRGLQHHLIRMGGRRPITKVDCSQQSCANLLVSVLLLSKVLNKNIKGKRQERGISGVLPHSLTSPSAAVKQQMNILVLRGFCKTKVVFLPEPTIFLPHF